METNRNDTPFDELRSLVQELLPLVDSGPVSRSGNTETSELFAKIDDWITLAEQRRDQSESIIESARDAFVAMNSKGIIISWNQQSEKIFGWTASEAMGRSVAELIVPPEHRQAHEKGLERFLATGDGPVLNQRIEVTALRRDGTQFPAELTVLEPQKIGNSLVFNAFVRDITQLKQAVEAIQNSEALYHSLVDRLPINVTRKDLDGRITFANTPFCDLVERTSEELIGLTDYDLSPPEVAEKFQRDDRKVVETGNVFHAVEENRHEGGLRHFEVWKVPVRDPSDNIVETQAVFWDVTEREENRTALARERDLLRTLMDGLPDPIYVKDNQQRFITVNQAMLDLLGEPSSESVVGKTVFDFAPADLAIECASDDREVLETDSPIVDREVHVVDCHGEKRLYSTIKVPLHDPKGRVTGLVGIDRDITVRKEAEEELRRARQEADAANQAKSDFLANMSHEIRTPMNAIIGMTELALDTELTGTQREWLSTVRDSGDSLLLLINDILDFSKIEAGKFELQNVEFGLREHIGDTLKLLSVRADHAGLELVWRVAPNVPDLIIGDPHRLRQVLVNLIGNAIKFTEQGEVVLDVSTHDSKNDQFELAFSVRDTGIGIPDDKLATIFAAFEQADSSSTRRFSGTGLGLAISSRLVELMGGRIGVESQVGQGSTFTFTAGFTTTSEQEVSKDECVELKGTRVLVVDDNATNLRILDEVLGNWGMQPKAVTGAFEAMDALRDAKLAGQPFALVLSDVNMPDVDGLMLAEQIRADSDLSGTAIMMLTSGERITEVSRRKELGIVACLMKPIKQSELMDGIVSALAPQPLADLAAKSVAVDSIAELPPLKILLAEDSLTNQTLAVALLESRGHMVTVANNGREALAALGVALGASLGGGDDNYDVILMDVQMPEMDGFETTSRIRDMERASKTHTPIIAMTAHAMAGDRERCLSAGMDEYVSKPIRLAELTDRIGNCLRARVHRSSIPTHATELDELDWSAALEMTGGDRQILGDVVVAVLKEWPALLQQLDVAILSGDVSAVQRAAHTIGGTARGFHADNVAETAALLDAQGRAEKLENANDLLKRLKDQIEPVMASFVAFLDEDPQ